MFSPGRIVLCNLLGMILIASWLFPNLTFWNELDDAVFFLTNAWLEDANTLWVTFVAVTNHRAFDVASLLVLLAIFIWAMRRDTASTPRLLHWGGIGITMLITAVVLTQGVRLIVPYGHPSPTYAYDDVNLVSQLVEFATKDGSGNSFPGDHGVNLFLFTAFMWRFAGRQVALVSLFATLLLSAPRILSGGHWFSDVYFAALAINLIAAPWILFTPLGPRIANAVTTGLVSVRNRWLAN
ncbi:phosphatase PAP2 family protein [Halomonas faecis]|uniref:phosphatase PAP2 family protein n=1 Tax=Halomonas faecis TaxID=1562110 RepID=UPI001F091AE9|nr:phosphatase PAP2 family protein [Halomonas faecis]